MRCSGVIIFVGAVAFSIVGCEGSLPGLLYPRESKSREVKSLNGLWDFAVWTSRTRGKNPRDSLDDALAESVDVMQMPVPSSYNDVTTSRVIRDHVGTVWYERTFFVPKSWSDQLVFVYFGSVNYLAEVWVNGKFVTKHALGHLPFETEISKELIWGKKNRITVAVDNTLSRTSIPQGRSYEVKTDNGTKYAQSYSFDFFNYAGIHRPVLLHTKPRVYVEDITLKTSLEDSTGIVKYSIQVSGLNEDEVADCQVVLRKNDDSMAIEKALDGLDGTIKVPNAKLWWPRGMHPEPAYLYTFEVSLSVRNTMESDTYRLPFGIRSLSWSNKNVLINEKPVYMRGFGRHEDSPIRGRGLDLVTMTRDYELLKWVGANSYRTSHYPYSEEVLDMADRQGILIVNECPAVDITSYSQILQTNHKRAMSELIRRDKNRPSVIMWSIANEPRSSSLGTEDYYQNLTLHTRELDETRPITAALAVRNWDDKLGQFIDVIGFNRYNAWYSSAGSLDEIVDNVINEADHWHQKYDKPVMIFEYGADAMPGLHELPSYVWSEEYQRDVFSKHFMAFDCLRLKGFFIGEFIWNFADFRTAQGHTRVGGNKKGIFTRNREPKMAAHHVRKRYHALSVELDGAKTPNDLESYVSASYSAKNHQDYIIFHAAFRKLSKLGDMLTNV